MEHRLSGASKGITMLVSDEHTSSQDETHILHPSSRALFRFWESMRAEKAAPRRDELDLRKIRALVPNLFIADYAAKARMFRWRLAGTGICEVFRRELTGTNVLAGWDHFEADTIARFLTGTIRNLQPCLLRFRFFTDRDQVIGAEFVGFPLTAADGAATHILGGLFPFRDPGSLGYTALTHFELSAARSIWTELLPSDAPTPQATAGVVRNFQVITGGLT
jgi:hypothetical protein